MTARRGPRPVADALPGVLARAAPRTPLAAVQLAWQRAAGERIAAHSDAVSEREGTVTIACSSASWAEQLDLLQDELLDRLQTALGDRAEVSKLRFRVRGDEL